MLLFTSLIGLFISALLWIFNAIKFPASRYLAAFFFLISLYSVNIYVLLYSKSVFLNTLVATNFTFLYYSIGPVAYLYIRSILTDSVKLSPRDLFHFLPSILFFLAIIPYYLTPYEYKMHIASKIVANPQFLYTFKPTVFSVLFPVEWVYVSRPLSILGYALYSLYYYIRFAHKKQESISDPQFNLITKWLKVFLSFIFLVAISHSIMMHQSFESNNMIVFFTVNLLNNTFYASFLGLIITPFLFPCILYGLPQSSNTIQVEIPTECLENQQTDTKQMHRLEDTYLCMIATQMEQVFTKDQPFLQPDFNLTRLSNLLDIPIHHLAYYFREVKNQNFTDFRNEYRINYAAMLLETAQHKELTLEAIGQMAGFSSRVTFFRCFKKVKGVSPSEYSALQTA